MMHITEDTPPDMLTGAMDLTIHLPNGKSVKMSVERSTPMMDLLVQIATTHHLQLSSYILEALEMAPSNERRDRILPYKPNTPIGALDTQHIRVVQKSRTLPASKQTAPGHQPFESTFRLKVHLPRNQLYVIRVSQNVLIEEIMKKVCYEKNLDSIKYEVRHPGNLDEVLDPKLRLSDYQITEIYLTSKGTVGLTQTFSSNDIMVLRKEEERKQLHNKTGGGVFSLIFKRGKSSIGSGSLSSENRSISPTHSDESRSVTPPVVQQQIIQPQQKQSTSNERPKPPQRKRRPAPKPPQLNGENTSKPPSQISTNSDSGSSTLQPKLNESGLTICHSRNSSDSSGYHEPSTLSDHCNTTLPRKPKPVLIENCNSHSVEGKLNGEHSRSIGNLAKMSLHSKSTSSLLLSRKKKAAPPPPPLNNVAKTDSITNIDNASPLVVASHPINDKKEDKPIPLPRLNASKTLNNTPIPRPSRRMKKEIVNNQEEDCVRSNATTIINNENSEDNVRIMEESNVDDCHYENINFEKRTEEVKNLNECDDDDDKSKRRPPTVVGVIPKAKNEMQLNNTFDTFTRKRGFRIGAALINNEDYDGLSVNSFSDNSECQNSIKSDSLSLYSNNADDLSAHEIDEELFDNTKKIDATTSGVGVNTIMVTDNGCNVVGETFSESKIEENVNKQKTIETVKINDETSINENDNVQTENEKNKLEDKYKNGIVEIANISRKDAELITETETETKPQTKPETNRETKTEMQPKTKSETKIFDEVDEIKKELPKVKKDEEPERVIEKERDLEVNKFGRDRNKLEDINQNEVINVTDGKSEMSDKNKNESIELDEIETEWQYQLPSPPNGFRDNSPTSQLVNQIDEEDLKCDSVVTSPELFEKLKDVQIDKESTITSTTSDMNSVNEEICNKLTLENLEKRKSLVYNRELATSLKFAQSDNHNDKTDNNNTIDSFKSQCTYVMNELEDMLQQNKTSKQETRYDERTTTTTPQTESALPNFKITTYDNPKNNINIFEDDSIRSNTMNTEKRNSLTAIDSTKQIYPRRSSYDFKRPEFIKNKPKTFVNNNNKYHDNNITVVRSGSFSTNALTNWSPSNPVKRSKSQVALNKYKDEATEKQEETLTKSNSLFDISGLQSLEVMRKIQTKLSSPKQSEEILNENVKQEVKVEENAVEEVTEMKTYQYRGPPAINLSTWTERPKTQISIKEDTDYKYKKEKDNINSKIVVNGINHVNYKDNSGDTKNNHTNYTNGVNLRVGYGSNNNNDYETITYYENKNVEECKNPNNSSISIKVSSETKQQNNGVIIKIGPQKEEYNRFVNHTGPMGYRKPLGNINKNENGRPHSIAITDTSDYQPPIVRSVEYKKPYQNGRSVTQICTNNNNNFSVEPRSLNYHPSDKNDEINFVVKTERKPISRVSSYAQNFGPVVKGFKSVDVKKTWNNNYSTLPNKTVTQFNHNHNNNSNSNVTTNQNLSLIKRTESNNDNINNSDNNNITNRASLFGDVVLRNRQNAFVNHNKIGNRHSIAVDKLNSFKADVIPTPPPKLPELTKFNERNQKSTFNNPLDDRSQLLDDIRKFGGKKGLRTVKG